MMGRCSSRGRLEQMSYPSNTSISNISITTSGTGTNTFTSSGTYTISSVAYGGGGGGASTATWLGTTSSSLGFSDISASDVYLSRPNGRKIALGTILETIIDTLCIIEPDRDLIARYPALKEAYDDHQRLLTETFGNRKIRESYETYQTIKKLVSEQHDD